MKKDIIYMIRVYVAIATIVGSILAIFCAYYPIPFLDVQVPIVVKLFADFSIVTLILFFIVVIATIFLGKIYCSTICPFGIFQEILTYISKNKVINKNQPYKYFVAAIAFGFLLGGSSLIFKYLYPFTILDYLLSPTILSVVLLIGLLVLIFFKKRYFCTNICPVGAVLGLISKFSVLKIKIDTDKCVSCGLCEKACPAGCINIDAKTVDNETCIKCLKCMNVCKKDAIGYKRAKTTFNPKRRDFIISASALALFGGAVLAGINYSKKVGERLKKIILPAGAVNSSRMENTCLNCNLCVNNCPTKILKKADENFNAVYIDYQGASFGEKYCDYNCKRCSDVCPSGAIKKMSLEEKQKTRIAIATLNSEKCTTCRLCIQRCPTSAIYQNEKMEVLIDAEKCIGCGQCKAFCRFDAIEVYSVNKQTMI